MPRARVGLFFFWALSVSFCLPPPHRVSLFLTQDLLPLLSLAHAPPHPQHRIRPISRFRRNPPSCLAPPQTPPPPDDLLSLASSYTAGTAIGLFHALRPPPPPSSPLRSFPRGRGRSGRGGAASGGGAIGRRGQASRPAPPRPVPSQSSRASPAAAATAPRRLLYGAPTVGPTDRPRRAGEEAMPGRAPISANLGGPPGRPVSLGRMPLHPLPVRIPA